MKEPTRRFKDLYWGNKENQVLFCTALSFSKNFRICLAITPTQTVHECSNEENADIYRDRRIRKRCYNTPPPPPPPPIWSSFLFYFLACLYIYIHIYLYIYTGWPGKNGTVDTVDFSGLCSDQQLSFFTLLDRASFPHYNNTKIIKFG